MNRGTGHQHNRYTRYECPRCGRVSDRVSTYQSHMRRMKMCAAVKRDVVPDMLNVIVHRLEALVPPPSTTTTTTTNNTNNTNNNTNITNNNNNINIQVFAPPPLSSGKPIKRFPHQDLVHVSDDFKRAMVDMASKADGFVQAVQRMFQVTYFNPMQPHNMNIIISNGNDHVAHVAGRNETWNVMAADEAIKEMLDTQGDSIRNFPDEPGLEGTIPLAHVRTIDDAYIDGSFKDDPDLVKSVKHMAFQSHADLTAFSKNRSGHLERLPLYCKSSFGSNSPRMKSSCASLEPCRCLDTLNPIKKTATNFIGRTLVCSTTQLVFSPRRSGGRPASSAGACPWPGCSSLPGRRGSIAHHSCCIAGVRALLGRCRPGLRTSGRMKTCRLP